MTLKSDLDITKNEISFWFIGFGKIQIYLTWIIDWWLFKVCLCDDIRLLGDDVRLLSDGSRMWSTDLHSVNFCMVLGLSCFPRRLSQRSTCLSDNSVFFVTSWKCQCHKSWEKNSSTLGSTESIKPGEIVHFLKILKSWPKDHEVISDLSQNFSQSKYDCLSWNDNWNL